MASVNLVDLLCVCGKGCRAAQLFIALDLLKLEALGDLCTTSGATSVLELPETTRKQLVAALQSSVQVSVKSELDYKEGDAAKDLVTTADILTQAVLVKALQEAFPTLPFTVVGEEDAPSSGLLPKVEDCYARYYRGGDLDIPEEAALRAHFARHPGSAVVEAATLEELRQRVGVFIDPIDGTNCFVHGVWEAPMTLVGITVDGVPVAGFVNRVFVFPLGPHAHDRGRFAKSVSYVCNTATLIGHEPTSASERLPVTPSPFMVFEGARVDLAAAPHKPTLVNQSTTLDVVQSTTTKHDVLEGLGTRLQPQHSQFARGAGNKQYRLILRMIQQLSPTASSTATSASGEGSDVFICPGHTIKKWDCCAPQAFILSLGGELYDMEGFPLRYPLTLTDAEKRANANAQERLTELPDGVVAVTAQVKAEVARRLQWPTSRL